MRNNAVKAAVLGRRRNDNHLALGFGKSGITFHQRIMIGHKGAQFVWPVRQCHKHIWNKARLFLNLLEHEAHIGFQVTQFRHRIPAEGDCLAGHLAVPLCSVRRQSRVADRVPSNRVQPFLLTNLWLANL